MASLTTQRRNLSAAIREFKTACRRLAAPACEAIHKEGLSIGQYGTGRWHLTLLSGELTDNFGHAAKTSNLEDAVRHVCSRLSTRTMDEIFYMYQSSQWDSKYHCITPVYLAGWLDKAAEHLQDASRKHSRDRTLAKGFVAMQAIAEKYGPVAQQMYAYEQAAEREQQAAKRLTAERSERRNDRSHAAAVRRATRELRL